MLWLRHHNPKAPPAIPLLRVTDPTKVPVVAKILDQASTPSPSPAPKTTLVHATSLTPTEKLFATLKALAVGAVFSGGVAMLGHLSNPTIFLHPHNIKAEMIGAFIGGVAIYVSNSPYGKHLEEAGYGLVPSDAQPGAQSEAH